MKKIGITAFFVSAAMLLMKFSGVYAGAAAETIAVTPDKKYILADTDKAISLASIVITKDDQTTITGDKVTWTPDSGVTVQNGSLSVSQKGAHALTVYGDGYTDTVYLFAKGASDTEYTLYSEDFDNMADGTFPSGWTRTSGTTVSAAEVSGHQFVMNAKSSPDNPGRVVLPTYLSMFGDYKIQSDVKIMESNSTSRWASLMYRIQNSSSTHYPYYQMAVRVAASNSGVEFAERNSSNAWNVIQKSSYTSNLDSNTFYQFTVQTEGNRVVESINGTKVIDTDEATGYQKGAVGIQADGCKIAIDNIQVTLPTTKLPASTVPTPVDVYEPDTNLKIAPSVITEIKSASDLDGIAGNIRPATAIMHIDSSLNVLGADGKSIGTVSYVMHTLNNKVIPAFYVDDTTAADALAGYVNQNNLFDLFVMSDKSDVVAHARNQMPKVRGVVSFTLNASIAMSDVMKQTNSGSARVAVLPQSLATISNIEYLQNRLITVWVLTDSGITDKAAIANEITTGANGFITDNYKGYYEAYSLFTDTNAIARKVFIIGHRGLACDYPENTLISAQKAYEAGADCIENDIWLTTDGQIVIMHDSDVSRTTDGSGNIEDMTLAQVKALNCIQFADTYPNIKVPTLEEFFQNFKGKNVIHFIEIKSAKPEIVTKLKELIDKYDVVDQCVVISFVPSQLKQVHSEIPELSLGCLTNDSYGSSADMNARIEKTLDTVAAYNSTLNPGYTDLSDDYLNAMKDRGVTVWPWTLNSLLTLGDFMVSDNYGLTTDYAKWATNWADGITPSQDTYTLTEGVKSQITAQIHTYGDKTNEAPVSVEYVKGDNILTVNGNDITATGIGNVTVMLKYTQKTQSNARFNYTMYSKTVTITVVRNDNPTTTTTSSTNDTKTTVTTQTTDSTQSTTSTQTTNTKASVTPTAGSQAVLTPTAENQTANQAEAKSPNTGSNGIADAAIFVLLAAGSVTLFVRKRK